MIHHEITDNLRHFKSDYEDNFFFGFCCGMFDVNL